MASKKFYAVKVGLKPGIYKSWDECKKQVEGVSGAVYKSFVTLSEAEAFLGIANLNTVVTKELISKGISEAVAYVDGSYDITVKMFSYGLVLFIYGEEKHFAEKYDTDTLIEMRNVAGEITGAQKAMQYCVDVGIKSLDLYYDYEGIEKWCTGEWKANKPGTKSYKQFYDTIKDLLSVTFYKVVAHTGDKYNELADQLAKNALFANTLMTEIGDVEVAQSNNVYIEHDGIDDFIFNLGKSEWVDFNAQPLAKIGNQHRCVFMADGKEGKIDLYFKVDGTVTVKSTSAGSDISDKLVNLIIKNSFKNKHENSTCTFGNISIQLCARFIDYLKSTGKISVEEKRIDSPPHTQYKCRSNFGDSMAANFYDTGKLVLQGNPAYIFTEAFYFMSVATDEIAAEDIIARKNEVYKSNMTITAARTELKKRLPVAYEKLDNTILTLLSPSISLSMANVEVEDYSCYVFPAFKALEALLLHLLSKLSGNVIIIDAIHNFGSVFQPGSIPGKQVLIAKYSAVINNSVYQACLEDIYNYIKGTRHVYFHANQVLMLSAMIFDKVEADAILNQILDFFEDVGIKIL